MEKEKDEKSKFERKQGRVKAGEQKGKEFILSFLSDWYWMWLRTVSQQWSCPALHASIWLEYAAVFYAKRACISPSSFLLLCYAAGSAITYLTFHWYQCYRILGAEVQTQSCPYQSGHMELWPSKRSILSGRAPEMLVSSRLANRKQASTYITQRLTHCLSHLTYLCSILEVWGLGLCFQPVSFNTGTFGDLSKQRFILLSWSAAVPRPTALINTLCRQ